MRTRLSDVPDYLANYVSSANRAKASAIYAVLLGADNVHLIFIRPQALYFLDHSTVGVVAECDDILFPDRAQKKRDSGHQYEISIFEMG